MVCDLIWVGSTFASVSSPPAARTARPKHCTLRWRLRSESRPRVDVHTYGNKLLKYYPYTVGARTGVESEDPSGSGAGPRRRQARRKYYTSTTRDRYVYIFVPECSLLPLNATRRGLGFPFAGQDSVLDPSPLGCFLHRLGNDEQTFSPTPSSSRPETSRDALLERATCADWAAVRCSSCPRYRDDHTLSLHRCRRAWRSRGDHRLQVLRERNGLCGKAWPPSAATCESILKGDPCRLRAFAMGYAGLDKVTQQQEEEQQEEEQEHRATQQQEEERDPIRLWQAMSIRREFGEPPIIRDARPTMPAAVLPCTSTPRSAQAARLEWAWRTRSRAGHPRSAGARCSSTRRADLGCGT